MLLLVVISDLGKRKRVVVMNGIEREFTCKKCKTNQTHTIGITNIYKINNMDMEFIPIKCKECGEQHFIADSGHIVEEVTEEAKDIAFEEMAQFIGRSAKARERFIVDAKFIAIKDAVFTQDEVTSCIAVGVCCY